MAVYPESYKYNAIVELKNLDDDIYTVAKKFKIAYGTLHRWNKEIGPFIDLLIILEYYIKNMAKENEELKRENDLLKKKHS